MALTVTSLNGAITQAARQVTLTAFTNPSTGGIGAKTWALVNGEFMSVEDASLTPTLGVARGINGTLAVAHNTLAPVVYGLTSDFTDMASQGSDTIRVAPVVNYAVNGAVTIPYVNQIVYITKAGVCALTLNGTLPNDLAVEMTFISLTANAHTITYTAGFMGNTTSSDVATFAATAGATLTIRSKNGVWVQTSGVGVTVA